MDRDRWLAARAASRGVDPVQVVTDAEIHLHADGSATVSVRGQGLWSPGALPDLVVAGEAAVGVRLQRDGSLSGDLARWPNADHLSVATGSRRLDARVTRVVKPSAPARRPVDWLRRALAAALRRLPS
jgi:hypothetical protein